MAWVVGSGGTILANPNVINFCLAPSVTADHPSPQIAGTAINLTASSTGCTDPTYQFEMLAPGSQPWQVVQAYSFSNVFNWSTAGKVAGVYKFIVKTRDANSSGLAGNTSSTWDSYTTATFTLTTSACTGVTSSSSPPGTAVSGTAVVITGTATGCPNPRYQFEMLAPGSQTWQVVQGYSGGANFNWNTAGAAQGTYKFIIKARDLGSSGTAGSSTGSWDVYTVPSYTLTSTHCASVTAATSPSGTATGGTPVTITGNATGCPNPRYQFEMLKPNSQTWLVVQLYSSTNMFNWNTQGAAAGNYKFIVKARDASSASGWDAYISIPYTLTSTPCTSVTATSSPAGTTTTGTPVTITGTTAGCPNPQYLFQMLTPGSQTWQIVQGYSSSNTFSWNTTAAAKGTYKFIVMVRDASSAGTAGNSLASWDAYVLISYTLT